MWEAIDISVISWFTYQMSCQVSVFTLTNVPHLVVFMTRRDHQCFKHKTFAIPAIKGIDN